MPVRACVYDRSRLVCERVRASVCACMCVRMHLHTRVCARLYKHRDAQGRLLHDLITQDLEQDTHTAEACLASPTCASQAWGAYAHPMCPHACVLWCMAGVPPLLRLWSHISYVTYSPRRC